MHILRVGNGRPNDKDVPLDNRRRLKAENYGFAIRKGDDKLRARLDKVLDEIRADGTYDKIYAKWFGGNK